MWEILMNPFNKTKSNQPSPDSLELISEFSKITVYKISIQKLIEFLYVSNDHMDAVIKNTILFIIIQNISLGAYLTKHIKAHGELLTPFNHWH